MFLVIFDSLFAACSGFPVWGTCGAWAISAGIPWACWRYVVDTSAIAANCMQRKGRNWTIFLGSNPLPEANTRTSGLFCAALFYSSAEANAVGIFDILLDFQTVGLTDGLTGEPDAGMHLLVEGELLVVRCLSRMRIVISVLEREFHRFCRSHTHPIAVGRAEISLFVDNHRARLVIPSWGHVLASHL